ncbi:recombinase family protein [Nocardia bovistercoris]|uniref:Recombinase family protein n=1 Tax=Nocardia bovistercoris TaxID=2785916 RepID=A0A931N7B0_9NOCA|nr:recombinase family protein [Nocardia bovistercoris]MBH0781879.1 recombinase family protein [Nocardia bovistercoris]
MDLTEPQRDSGEAIISHRIDHNPDATFITAVLFLSMAHAPNNTSEVQAEPMAIKRQREYGLLTASALGVGIIKEFIEIGVPATALHYRPQLRKMLDYIRKHPDIRYAIFPRQERFARHPTHHVNLHEHFERLGVKVSFYEAVSRPILHRPTDDQNN